MSVILFIIILLVLILVHELGHFAVAKLFGIRVDEFGVGFPPRAMTLGKKGDTTYTLNWLPFGGFVKIFGEDPTDESLTGPDSKRSFATKPILVRAAVLVAGVAFNMLLAWFLMSAIFMIGTDTALEKDEIQSATNLRLNINYVLPDSPGAEVGLMVGDTITSLTSGNDTLLELTPEAASAFINEHGDESLALSVVRDGETYSYIVIPKKGILPLEPERALVGMSMSLVGFLSYGNPVTALTKGAVFTIDVTGFVWDGLVSFFLNILTFSADFSQVAGPIGIVGIVGEAAGVGLVPVLFLTAIISINLAIINILPIPALDGGRLLFLIIEGIKGSPVKPSIANTIHGIFFVLLILLVIVVSYYDILRLS